MLKNPYDHVAPLRLPRKGPCLAFLTIRGKAVGLALRWASTILGLVVWAILRHRAVGAHGKLWFHWALFVCVLCAAFAPFDSNFGFLVMPRFE